jgi:MerR family transcriptional regulator/heat shock protein HspR
VPTERERLRQKAEDTRHKADDNSVLSPPERSDASVLTTDTRLPALRLTPEEDRPRYVISVAAQILHLHPQTLRLYEREGLVEPKRTGGKIRLYSERDLDQIRRITRLTNDLGVNLAGAEIIISMRERLIEMRQEMDKLRRRMEAEIEELRRMLGSED